MNYWQQFLELSQQPFFPQLLSLMNIILIFLTVLIMYLSWNAAMKANELQLLPLLAIYFRGNALKDRTIRIRNIGKSPAYDIKIESFATILTDVQHVWRLDLSLSGTNVLVADEESWTSFKCHKTAKRSYVVRRRKIDEVRYTIIEMQRAPNFGALCGSSRCHKQRVS